MPHDCLCEVCQANIEDDNEAVAHVVQKTLGKIRRRGWAWVMITDAEFPYAYTIGMSQHLNRPEVVLTGIDPDTTQWLFDDIARAAKKRTRLPSNGRYDRLIKDMPVWFKPVSLAFREHCMGLGRRILGKTPEAVQLILPDPNGLFPWQAGCDATFRRGQKPLTDWRNWPDYLTPEQRPH